LRSESWLLVLAVATAAGCGSGGSGAPTGTSSVPGNAVTGSVQGRSFASVSTAYWIGNPSAGSLPTQVFLAEATLDCAAISVPLWDKTFGDQQLLELGVTASDARTYQIGTDAEANYLGGAINPTADSGTVTISSVHPSQSIAGSFVLSFGTDALTGSFDAAYCATGVEP
jgi:hypothetical protein